MAEKNVIAPALILSGAAVGLYLLTRKVTRKAREEVGIDPDQRFSPSDEEESGSEEYSADTGWTIIPKRTVAVGTKVYPGQISVWFYPFPKPDISTIRSSLSRCTLSLRSNRQPGGFSVAASQYWRGYSTAPGCSPISLLCYIELPQYGPYGTAWYPGDRCYWQVTYPGYGTSSTRSFYAQ